MGTTIILAAALAAFPGQAGGLSLTNVRNTYGELGPARPDAKLLPGDIFFLTFDIEGVKVDGTGKVEYSMAMEVLDKAKKAIFKQDPIARKEFLPLGGSKLPARAFVGVGLDQEPGEYTVKLTITDAATKGSTSIERKYEVLSRDFGIVQVMPAYDPKNEVPAPSYGVAGQAIFLHFALVGFEREKGSKQPKLEIRTVTFDEKGKPTLEKPIVQTFDKDVPEGESLFPARFPFPLNRPGKFSVELTATDVLTKKSAKVTLPVVVVPPPN